MTYSTSIFGLHMRHEKILYIYFFRCASVSSDSSVLVEYAAPTSEGAINLVLHTSSLPSEVGTLAGCCAWAASLLDVLTEIFVFCSQGVHAL